VKTTSTTTNSKSQANRPTTRPPVQTLYLYASFKRRKKNQQGIISVLGLVEVPAQFAPLVSLLITQLLVRNARCVCVWLCVVYVCGRVDDGMFGGGGGGGGGGGPGC
jgi:hypothetical protein